MTHKFKIFLLTIALLSLTFVKGQGSFEFPNNQTSDKINFKLINNLILLPVNVNGVDLNFLLDTGASSTVIFSFEGTEEIELFNYTVVKLRGLGKDEPVDALKSDRNTIQIGNAVKKDLTIYVVFEGALNFSSRLGYPVHGIIGYDFLKDFVVDVNNVREFLRFYIPENYTDKQCKRCVEKKLILNANKPFITAKFQSESISMNVNLLIDSGSSDGLWLFENSSENIVIPENSFEDYLGLGINGNIYGKRSKVDKFKLSDFELKNVNTAYLITDFIDELNSMGTRNGSMGGEILKRFNWTIDYSKRRLLLKKNRFFKEPFYYNMSGLTLQQGGFTLVNERVGVQPGSSTMKPSETASAFNLNLSTKVVVTLKQLYEVIEIRENSPAYIAGIRIGDEILEVNNKPAYQYTLNELYNLFYSREGKTIRMKISRNGTEMYKRFALKDMY